MTRSSSRSSLYKTRGDSLASLALFTLAAWGVFKSDSWWERAASAGAIVGLATLVPYEFAASSTGVSGPGLNSAIHIAGSAMVLLVLLVPALESRMTAWLSGEGRASKHRSPRRVSRA